MNLSLFHPDPSRPAGRYRTMDKYNSWTGYFPCRYLEFTGWYSSSLSLRLLGHFRLFQLFLRHYKPQFSGLSAERAYILDYRAFHAPKHFLYRALSLLPRFFSFGHPDSWVQIGIINRQLLHGSSPILEEFLAAAQQDFEKAFFLAKEKINDPLFFHHPVPPPAVQPHYLVQHNEKHDHHYLLHYEDNRAFNLQFQTLVNHPAILHGKEKGSLSKKQILMLLDLISREIENTALDLSKPGRYKGLAEFLAALTGRPDSAWMEEIEDHKSDGLYGYQKEGEIRQILGNLTTIKKLCDRAGFHRLAELADDRSDDLRRKNKFE